MSHFHRDEVLPDIGGPHAPRRTYDYGAWIASRRRAVGPFERDFAWLRYPIEAVGAGCVSCSTPNRILWGASPQDALFCGDCLTHTGPVKPGDEIGGSG